ncbi:MAG: acetoacetate decarboxylase family protein [Polyangiales bacterium]
MDQPLPHAPSQEPAALESPFVLEPDAALPEVPLHPAPWQLRGSAYVFAVHMPEDVLDHAAFIPKSWVAKRRGRTAYVMFVDYQSSNAGPYRELLVSPASFAFDGSYPAITRIYVSSYDSVVNGRRNWGIPKDRADFDIQPDAANGGHVVHVTREGRTIAELSLRAHGPKLPVRTWLLPAGLRTLVQPWQDQFFRFTLSASGNARLATLKHWSFDPTLFPDLSRGRVLAGAYLPEFEMTFPVAQITPRR